MAIDWAGARVVVTGGSSGIGLAIARRAASLGANVCIVDIHADRAGQARDAIVAAGGMARSYACDVGDAEQVAALARTIAEDIGGVDILFNNAGVGLGGKLERVSPRDADWVIAVNLGGLINGARSFVPLLRQAAAAGRTAWIVNTGSEHSLGIPTIGASNVYTATKHAALGISDVLRADLAGSGVQVAILCPGLVATNIFDARAVRPDGFGGPEILSPEHFDKIKAFMDAKGQDPNLTAELCFEGLDRGDFIIIADPDVGVFARKRIAEIQYALDKVEQRLKP